MVWKRKHLPVLKALLIITVAAFAVAEVSVVCECECVGMHVC